MSSGFSKLNIRKHVPQADQAKYSMLGSGVASPVIKPREVKKPGKTPTIKKTASTASATCVNSTNANSMA